MDTMTVTHGDYLISTDKEKLQLDVIFEYLSERSYWANGRSYDTFHRSVNGSLCFGIYHFDKQVGFARVITDFGTFAYLADVFVLEEYRGRGLSKWLMEVILADPELQTVKRWLLATADAHGLYSKYGFTQLSKPERWMEMGRPNAVNQT